MNPTWTNTRNNLSVEALFPFDAFLKTALQLKSGDIVVVKVNGVVTSTLLWKWGRFSFINN